MKWNHHYLKETGIYIDNRYKIFIYIPTFTLWNPKFPTKFGTYLTENIVSNTKTNRVCGQNYHLFWYIRNTYVHCGQNAELRSMLKQTVHKVRTNLQCNPTANYITDAEARWPNRLKPTQNPTNKDLEQLTLEEITVT